MKIYRITGQQNNIQFTQNVSAVDYNHARAKFINMNTKFQDYNYYLPVPDIIKIDIKNRRW